MTSPNDSGTVPVTPGEPTDRMTVIERLIVKYLSSTIYTKIDLFNEIGLYQIDDLLDLEQHHLENTTIIRDGRENLRFKPLEVTAIMSLKEWVLDLEFPKSWETQNKQDFLTWKKQGKKPTTDTTDDSTVTAADKETKSTFTKAKKQLSDFKDMNKDVFFASWYEEFETTACLHDLEDLLDPDFKPESGEEKTFLEKNKYLFNVLASKMKTSKSKKFVRLHRESKDGQKCLAEIVKEFNEGLTGQLKIEKLEETAREFKLDKSWKNTCTNFLDMWEHKIIDLERMKTISEETKKQWLLKTIEPHESLYDVRNQMRIFQNVNGKADSTFEEMFEVFHQQAILIDRKSKSKKEDEKKVRLANQHKTTTSSADTPDTTKKILDKWKGKHVPQEIWMKFSREQQKALMKAKGTWKDKPPNRNGRRGSGGPASP